MEIFLGWKTNFKFSTKQPDIEAKIGNDFFAYLLEILEKHIENVRNRESIDFLDET